MIDWVSVVIPIKHKPIKAGHYLMFDEDGEILSNKPVYKHFKGSFEQKIGLRSQGDLDANGYISQLFLFGNPSKYLQGHNVFGIDDLCDLIRGTMLDVCERYDLGINLLTLMGAIDSGVVSRIDFTKSIKFQNRMQVRAYIKQLSLVAHTRSGRPQQKKWTLAFQSTSKRWSAVIYSKGDEVESNKLHKDFEEKDFIHSVADSLVRVELRFKTLELIDLNLRKVHQLTSEKLHEIYSEFLGRINMPTSIELTSDQVDSLSRTLKATYLLWKSGIDVQNDMSKSTYYRHVSEIKKIGVDISIPYQESSVSNVIPLKTVLHAELFETPQEAFDKGLVYQPRQLTVV